MEEHLFQSHRVSTKDTTCENKKEKMKKKDETCPSVAHIADSLYPLKKVLPPFGFKEDGVKKSLRTVDNKGVIETFQASKPIARKRDLSTCYSQDKDLLLSHCQLKKSDLENMEIDNNTEESLCNHKKRKFPQDITVERINNSSDTQGGSAVPVIQNYNVNNGMGTQVVIPDRTHDLVIGVNGSTALDSPQSDDILPLSPIPSPKEVNTIQFDQLILKSTPQISHTPSSIQELAQSLSKTEYRSLIFQLLQNLHKNELSDIGDTINIALKADMINRVPVELLTEILSNLHYDDIKSCMFLNKNWNTFITHTPKIWQNLMLQEGFIESDHYSNYCQSTALTRKTDFYKNNFILNWKYYEHWRNPNFIPKETRMKGHVVSIITCLQFADDVVITGADDRMIHIYDANKGKLLKELAGHEGGVWALTYHKESKLLISGGTDRTVRVWNIETGVCTHVFRGHTSTVRCLDVFEHDNQFFIVSGSRDSTLHVWKLPDPKDPEYDPEKTQNYPIPEFNKFFVSVLKGHTGSVRTLSGHGNIVISGSYDHTLRVWDLSTMKCLYELVGHTHRIYSVIYDYKRKRCISSSMDFAIRIWDLKDVDNNRNKNGEICHDFEVYPDGCIKILGSMETLQGHTGLVGILSMSKTMIISAAADGTIRGWDCDDYTPCFSYNHKRISAVTTFFMNENFLVSGSEIQFTIYNLRTKQVIHTDLLQDADQIWSVKFDNKKLVAAIEVNRKSFVVILDFAQDMYGRFENLKRLEVGSSEMGPSWGEDTNAGNSDYYEMHEGLGVLTYDTQKYDLQDSESAFTQRNNENSLSNFELQPEQADNLMRRDAASNVMSRLLDRIANTDSQNPASRPND